MNYRSDSFTSIDMTSFVGKSIQGKYTLREYIDEGNFGVLFKSEQQFLDIPVRRVAVKISKQTGLDIEKVKDIFADVFLLTAAMDEMTDSEAKSHLVHVYDAGILSGEGDRAFLVMEYVDGTTLSNQFKSYRQVPASLMMKWARQICRALKGLHTLVPPVLHRDLKPSNILLGIDCNVQVVDFGLAAKMTLHGFVPGVAGTIDYMAPETILGKSVPASDVYSIGIILYEGLTGKHPFADLVPLIDLPNAMYNDWLYKQKSIFRPVPPSSLNNTVTHDLDDVVMGCLEFKQTERQYHNAEALLRVLEKLETPPPASPGENSLEKGHRWRAEGNWEEAYIAFKEGLKASANPKKIRFALLNELGEVLIIMRNYKEAAQWLVEAWEIAKNSGEILRSRLERANFLEKIVQVFLAIPNNYQANKYEDLKKAELQNSRR
ncbi:MAG: protein kinase [Candidatus Aminicenantes bacterium]|nr:protein kinase [Candidatus Aminicenantes bacterium]NIN18810.1 protein kinase [Candidatus Aminicenantes bacterium]NIN42732.1 protein kinase [Candidatus Aminicenantes bacterium]NIN88143.1 protein kinase [Candidatus Aminicenantes bacterium]NIO81701.1 protein kinase [Candidatus Aminicenantes bacterium]